MDSKIIQIICLPAHGTMGINKVAALTADGSFWIRGLDYRWYEQDTSSVVYLEDQND